MGGKSKGGNDQMIAFQRQQAEEARQREIERQRRLDEGKATVNALFRGGGFDDAFYNKYRDAALDFSLPQLTDQYTKSRRDATNDLARAGLLRSSVAGNVLADIESQNAVNEASIRTKADTDVSALRQHIAEQEQQALNQLYATEDPTVAANTATHSVQQAQLSQPNLQPLGELFKPLIIGGAAGLNSAIDNYYIRRGQQPRGINTSSGEQGTG